MNESDTNNFSETDWERIDSQADDAIDRSELGPLDESFFDRAKWRMPEGQAVVAMPIDSDVLAWFQAQGSQSQQRMIAALRIYVEVHKDLARRPDEEAA